MVAELQELHRAVQYLAGVCDGAHVRDGQGFNFYDSTFGKSLAMQEYWSEKQTASVISLLRTYRAQLQAAGFDVHKLSGDVAVNTPAAPVPAPPHPVVVEGIYKDSQLTEVLIRCPYLWNPKVRALLTVRWCTQHKGWRVALNLENVNRLERGLAVQLPAEILAWRVQQHQLLFLAQQTDVSSLKSPAAAHLYGFQRVGVKFLTQARRVILADDMGLGKTVQAIVACEELQAQRVLVVCLNSLKGNWYNEIQKWVPHQQTTVLRGTRTQRDALLHAFQAGFLVVNYEAVRPSKSKSQPSLLDTLAGIPWDVLIVDEAHNMKNRKAAQTAGVRMLATQTGTVYLLTGTPILNRVDELWSPLHVLYPKRYASFWGFVEKHTAVYRNRYGWVVDGKPTQPVVLRKEIAPLFLRREKEEVFPDMPRKIYQDVWLDLEGEQQRIYRDIEHQAMTQIDENTTVITPGILAQLTRCKQVAISPGLIGGESTGVKLDALMDIVLGTEQKVLVFSQYAQAVELAASLMQTAGVKHVTFTGDTPEAERSAVVHQFQTDPTIKVFLATTQAGGVGLTLTAASLVVFLDKHWTPAVNEQAVDRTRPHLQTQPVHTIYLLCRNTVDELVENVLSGKASIIEAVVAKRKEVQ